MTRHVEVLLEGGSRSGKTFICVRNIIIRASKHPKSRHLILRKHFSHVKQSIWYQTIPDVLDTAFPGLSVRENKSDWYIEFPNGSQIWIAGTDDKERIEKILGTEWDTIYLNEASQLPFDTYDTFKTRLNPGEGVKPLFLIDYNPPSKSHWGYVIFHQGLDYESKQPHKNTDRYAYISMNPGDNLDNLSQGYIETLESMSESKQRRFLQGEYSDDSLYALWRRKWISSSRIKQKPNNITSCVVAIDPNVTDDKKATDSTDEAGIITVGKYMLDDEWHYVVLSDDSTIGLSWGGVSVKAYHDHEADKIIGEVNQGGDLVEMNIRNYDSNVPYADVRGTRGKATRAEPVADLYRRGYVHHFGEFTELEDELCTWVPGKSRSPNRLDALVWGILYLMSNGVGNIEFGVV